MPPCDVKSWREVCEHCFSDDWIGRFSSMGFHGEGGGGDALASERLFSRKHSGVEEMCMILEKSTFLRKSFCCTHDRNFHLYSGPASVKAVGGKRCLAYSIMGRANLMNCLVFAVVFQRLSRSRLPWPSVSWRRTLHLGCCGKPATGFTTPSPRKPHGQRYQCCGAAFQDPHRASAEFGLSSHFTGLWFRGKSFGAFVLGP